VLDGYKASPSPPSLNYLPTVWIGLQWRHRLFSFTGDNREIEWLVKLAKIAIRSHWNYQLKHDSHSVSFRSVFQLTNVIAIESSSSSSSSSFSSNKKVTKRNLYTKSYTIKQQECLQSIRTMKLLS